MPGAAIAVLICFWYYQTATKLNLNPLPWIVGALVVYYGVKYGWTFGVMKPVFGKQMLGPLVNDLSGAAVGGAAAALFRSAVMLKKTPGE